MKALRNFSMQFPEAQEGVACEGTAAEKRTVKVRNKAFLFFGATEMMLKLSDSLAEATKIAADKSGGCKVGAHGWVTVKIGNGDSVPRDLLKRWIDESYRLLAPKELVAKRAPKKAPAKKRAKKKAASA